MIKLIATDMDGTLLNSEKQPPADFEEVLDELARRGIAFAAATGRDHTSVARNLGRCAEKMMFLCDNGASLYRGMQLLEAHPLPGALLPRIQEVLQKAGVSHTLLCAEKNRYCTGTDAEFLEQMLRLYPNTSLCGNMTDITEPLFKISIRYPGEDIGELLLQPLREALGAEASVLHSAKAWIDIMAGGVDKGEGLRRLCQLLGIDAAQAMAFGDYYNDLPLLEAAGHPFIMPNAPQDLQDRYPHAAADWNHGGVTLTIRQLLLDGAPCPDTPRSV